MKRCINCGRVDLEDYCLDCAADRRAVCDPAASDAEVIQAIDRYLDRGMWAALPGDHEILTMARNALSRARALKLQGYPRP